MENLEWLVSPERGLVPLLAGLIILFSLFLMKSIIKDYREHDHKKLEEMNGALKENTKAVIVLTTTLQAHDNRIVESDILAAKNDVRLSRLIAAVKELAGDRWGEIQKKVKDEEFIHRDHK